MEKEMLTSRTNPLIKQISRLRNKKYRDEYGLFVVEGEKFVMDACRRQAPAALLATPDKIGNFPDAALVHPDIMSWISAVKTNQGVLALFDQKEYTLDDLSKAPQILYLSGIQDAENAGALVRSAVCAGFGAVVSDSNTADVYGPKAVRTSATSIMALAVNREGTKALSWLKQNGYRIICADLAGDEGFVKQEKPFVLVVGSEGQGIEPEVLAMCDERVRLPIAGDCESLNAAVAGGILMYKAMGL